ncbi:hypothetical protein BH10PSE19_BH10PSE19_14840 [soil metagenome]
MNFVSYAQNFEDVMLWRALKHVQNGVYVDVGAQHPVIDSVSKAFYERGWRGIHIEPVLEYAELLRRDRVDEIVLQVALADTEGTLELYVIPNTGLTTAVEAIAQRHQDEHSYERQQRIHVPVLKLKSALLSLVGQEVHWLKIDVEGFEENVLKGWDSKILRPWIIVVEATVPNSPEKNHANWEPILTAACYQFVYFDGLNRFYIADEHAELAEAFSCPPNIFDNIEITVNSYLTGTLLASYKADKHQLLCHIECLQAELKIAKEHEDSLQDQIAELKISRQCLQTELKISKECESSMQTQFAELKNNRQCLQPELKIAKEYEGSMQAQIAELNKTSHYWQTVAQEMSRELQNVYISKSWRVTLPLRKLMLAIKRVIASDIPALEQEQINPEATKRESVAHSISPQHTKCQLLIDISALVQYDYKTGIQRVLRNILQELLTHPPEGFCVEPVYASVTEGYRYARRFTHNFLGCPNSLIDDIIIDFQAGDVFLGLDLHHNVVITHQLFYQQLRNYGVRVQFVVYDLLPIVMPNCFPAGLDQFHQDLLTVISQSDGAICISKSVADELMDWLKKNGIAPQRPFTVNWFHLGADINTSSSSQGMPDDAEVILKTLFKRLTFLMVGTIEPRKGHTQTVAAFELLWAEGIDVNLVIVGKQGWMMDNLVERLSYHPEWGKRLFWLKSISDEYLEKIYASSNCLIAASEGEGFGLPIIEAAQHKLPIIARDIPIFHEVAGEHALYFSGTNPKDLSASVREWLALYEAKKHPTSERMPWLMWCESAKQLKQLLLQV